MSPLNYPRRSKQLFCLSTQVFSASALLENSFKET